MSSVKPTRYIELIDDIRNHVFQWATDSDWGKLPPKVNVALTTLINELKIAEAVKTSRHKDGCNTLVSINNITDYSIFCNNHLKASEYIKLAVKEYTT